MPKQRRNRWCRRFAMHGDQCKGENIVQARLESPTPWLLDNTAHLDVLLAAGRPISTCLNGPRLRKQHSTSQPFESRMRFEIGKRRAGGSDSSNGVTKRHLSTNRAQMRRRQGGSDPEMWSGLGEDVPSPRWRNPDESSASTRSPQQMIRSVEQLSWCSQFVVRLPLTPDGNCQRRAPSCIDSGVGVDALQEGKRGSREWRNGGPDTGYAKAMKAA
ncbi:hypothetical protein N431DRAFT_449894 [Stipitochalara longipes BDJ]|nr:hypothetical protein N431DRAFT_449894 [Stipitochalara longipes BDJ]